MHHRYQSRFHPRGHQGDDNEHQLAIGLAEVLAKSSNVGMTKIALTLEPQQIWTTLTQLGFGRVTASEFPGESAGVLSNYSSWRPIGISSLSRGYGLSVTPLQLAQAYATLGAFGVSRPVTMRKVEPWWLASVPIKNSRTLTRCSSPWSRRWHRQAPPFRLPRCRQDGHRVGPSAAAMQMTATWESSVALRQRPGLRPAAVVVS